jgi:hypothetical protein
MRKFVPVALALLALLTFSGGSVLAQGESSTIVLMEQNNSGQSGTATFTLSDNDTTLTIEINISGGTAEPQPAHIHIGTCADLDPKPFYPLNSVVNGKSVTVITEADLVNVDYEVSNQFAINVHKSAAEASVYVACGDIVPGGTVVGMPTTGSSDNGNYAPVLAFVALGLVATGSVLSFSVRRRKA